MAKRHGGAAGSGVPPRLDGEPEAALRKDWPVSDPPWPESGPALAVSFSGGGFRASLAGVGTIRALADLGLLGQVRYASSVSGGSWANGLLALNWEELSDRGFDRAAVDDLIVRPFVDKISTRSLGRRMVLNMWRVLGPKTRTDLLADAFDSWFGADRRLRNLPEGCRFIFNATNLATGARFGFERERVGDDRFGYLAAPELSIAEAVAASAALPGMLAVHHLRPPYGVKPRRFRPDLVDGAVYDNLGIEPFLQLPRRPLVVMLDAGARLHMGITTRLGIWQTLRRSAEVGQDQLTTVRRHWAIDRFRTWEEWEDAEPDKYSTYNSNQEECDRAIAAWTERTRSGQAGPDDVPPLMPPPRALRGVAFGLRTSMGRKEGEPESMLSRHNRYRPDSDVPELPPWHDSDADVQTWRETCVDVPMSIGRFDPLVCRDLVYRGWWLTRESLRTFHADAIRAPLPSWTEWYQP